MVQRSPLTDIKADASEAVQPPRLTPRPTFQQVFDEQASFVWRSLRHLGVPPADVEDICQEVFVVVHRKLTEFEGRSSIKTWLYGICIRVAKDFRRRAYVRREVVSSELPARAQPALQEQELQQGETRRILNEILEQLDDDKRSVFVAYEIEGMDMKDIAIAMDCPLQTAYSRLHAARKVVVHLAKRAFLIGAVK